MKAKLKELGTISTGNTPSKSVSKFYDSNDIGFVKPDIISDSQIDYIEKTTEYLSEAARGKARIIKKEAVFVTCIGSIGKVGIAKGEELAFNQQINAIEPNKKVISKYLAYAIVANKRKLQAIANAPVVPIINKTQFGEFEIDITGDTEEQAKIVEILDKVSAIIVDRKAESQKLDLLIKARFVELFGDYDLSHTQSDWKPISEIGKVVGGATPKTNIEEYWDGEYRWITPAELDADSGYIYDSVRKLTKAGVESCSLQEMPVNTVILSSRAPIGKVAIAGNTFYCNQGFKNIICNEGIVPRYLYTILLLNTEYLNSLGRGATFKEISKSIVENIKIPVPSVGLQEQFAAFVEQTDKSKIAVQKAIDEAQLLFDSLMQKYFR